MWIIKHKEAILANTASETEQGAWNKLIKTYPTLVKYSRKELELFFGYTCKKTKEKKV